MTTLLNIVKEHAAKESFNRFKTDIEQGLTFFSPQDIREYCIQNSNNNYILEFGVWQGDSINHFSNYVPKIYGFDSFEGLSEDWKGNLRPKGTFNLGRNLPKVNHNVELIVGWIEDTLDNFLKTHNPKISFAHMDFDTYSPTKYALRKIKPYLEDGAILLFDELYNYPGWKIGEYKALYETFNRDEISFIAFNLQGEQVAAKYKKEESSSNR